MRSVLNQSQFTPFGIWMRENLRSSRDGLCITNLDYVLEDFRARKIMLLEEKQNGGNMHHGQTLTFFAVHKALLELAARDGYEYWGVYVLRFPVGKTMPGPGMTLNGVPVTCEQLVAHLNFERRHCDPLWPVRAHEPEPDLEPGFPF